MSTRLPNQRSPKSINSISEIKPAQDIHHSKNYNGHGNTESLLLKTTSGAANNPVLLYKNQEEYKSLSNKSKSNQTFFSTKKKPIISENEVSQPIQHQQIPDGLQELQNIDKDFNSEGLQNVELANFANFVTRSRQSENPVEGTNKGDLKSPKKLKDEKDKRDSPKSRKLPKVTQKPVLKQAPFKDNSVEPLPQKLFQPVHTYTVKTVATIYTQKIESSIDPAVQTIHSKKRQTKDLSKSGTFEGFKRHSNSPEKNEAEGLTKKKKELKSAISSVLMEHLNQYKNKRDKTFFSVTAAKQDGIDTDSDSDEKKDQPNKKQVGSIVYSPERSLPSALPKTSHLRSPFKSFYYSPHKNVGDDSETKEPESINYSLMVSGVQKPIDTSNTRKIKMRSNIQSFRQVTLGDAKNWLLDSLALKELRDDTTKSPLYSSSFRPATGWNQKRRQYIDKINQYLEVQSKEAHQTDQTQDYKAQQTDLNRLNSEGGDTFVDKEGDVRMTGPANIRFMVQKGQHFKLDGKGHVRIQTVKPVEKDRRDEHFLYHLEAYKEFMLKINFSFNVIAKSPDIKTYPCYKYFIGQGNNAALIRTLMRQRWWWAQADNKDVTDINFMWTQIKQNKFIEALKPKRKALNGGDNESITGTLSETAGHNISLSDSTNETDNEIESKITASGTLKKGKSDPHIVQRKSSGSIVKEDHLQKTRGDDVIIVKEGFDKLLTHTEALLLRNHQSIKFSSKDYEELCKFKKGSNLQVISEPSHLRMCNHIENNFHLGNKKALLWNMRSYYESLKEDVFNYLPLTFHIQTGTDDPEFHKFLEAYQKREKEGGLQGDDNKGNKPKTFHNAWIVKPGEETNRGRGITVCSDIEQIKEIVSANELIFNGVKRTYLVQEYLTKPLLYNKRKFDIRCYFLISCINGIYKGYWYQEGYIRTATKEFNLKNLQNKQIHLTNDAIQKKFDDYGKFENGNKLSFTDFNKYLESQDGNVNFYKDIYPQIRSLGIDAIRAVYGKVDPNKREHYFEVFGLDFMIDTDLRAWLIEINTNPDITTTSPVLTKIIPSMVDNALKIALDPMFPPPTWLNTKKHLIPENLVENNKFELVFDELEDGPALRSVLKPDNAAMDLIFEMEGEQEEDNQE